MNYVLEMGVAKVDITPETPIPLAGFGFRSGPYEGVTRPLYAKVSLFRQPAAAGGAPVQLLVVQADLIALSPDVVPGFASAIAERYGLAGTSVLYNASHTHGGPFMRGGIAAGPIDTGYTRLLEARLLQATEEAFANAEPVGAAKALGASGIGIHRRKVVNGKMTMAPNREGPIDREVTVVTFSRTSDGTPKGMFVHFTCHPTTTGDNLINSDFPGVAMESIEEAVGGGVVATFLQGCCGDIRPNVTNESGGFYRGDDRDVRRLGTMLGDEVAAIWSKEARTLEPCALEVRDTMVRLPFDDALAEPEESLPERYAKLRREWLELSPDNRLYKPMRVSYMKLAEGLELVGFEGEVVVEYGLHLKAQFPDAVLPLAYTNGVIAYIPTAAQLIEGGYEPRESIRLFGLPAPFSGAIEALIREAAVSLVRGE
ncbi:hypothetical protein [Paenibacillus koleovorans]|uniref:hypothetical protein n=1 Tax=Paenibacillus koleovorans TaxID=121608 RepID=UPI000FDCBCE9|nr:hypothetical protein [Paenibacillus koleovorans]